MRSRPRSRRRSRPRSRPRRASKRRVYGATSGITGTYKDGMLNIGTFPEKMRYMRPNITTDKQLTLTLELTDDIATSCNIVFKKETYGLHGTPLRTTEDVVFIGDYNDEKVRYAVKLIEVDTNEHKKLQANYEVLCTEYASFENFGAEFVCSVGLDNYLALVTKYLPHPLYSADVKLDDNVGNIMVETFKKMLVVDYYNLDMNRGNMFLDEHGIPRIIDQGRVSQNSDHRAEFLEEIQMLATALSEKNTNITTKLNDFVSIEQRKVSATPSSTASAVLNRATQSSTASAVLNGLPSPFSFNVPSGQMSPYSTDSSSTPGVDRTTSPHAPLPVVNLFPRLNDVTP